MKKMFTLILVLGIILVAGIIMYEVLERISETIEKAKEQEETGTKIADNKAGELPTSSPISQETAEEDSCGEGCGGGGGGGGGGTSDGGGDATPPEDQDQLPSDLETRPCGFYYGEYKVCTGVCTIGTCIQEGKSCYCKII